MVNVPSFNECGYPCEECDHFRTYFDNYDSPNKIQCYECTKQGVMIKQRDVNSDKGIRLLMIYCPFGVDIDD